MEPTPIKKIKLSSAHLPQLPIHQHQLDFDYESYPFMGWRNVSDQLFQHQMAMWNYFNSNMHILYGNNPFIHNPCFQMGYPIRSYCFGPCGVVNNPIILDE
jgi:hypothetical protein